MAAAALARAAVRAAGRRLLARRRPTRPGSVPELLTSTARRTAWLPAPTDGSQIAYGADARVQSVLAVAAATGRPGSGSWPGSPPAGSSARTRPAQPMYDPATGVTDDGVAADGTVNRNSGAESTIHGLLSMLALDAHPDIARIARRSGEIVSRDGTTSIEAESAAVTGDAVAATADPAGTAESAWSGGRYLSVTGAARATWTVPPADQPRRLEAVVDRVPGRAARATVAGVGGFDIGGGGAQGASAVPGELVPVVVGTLPAGATSITAAFTGGAGKVDALLLTPAVGVLRTAHETVLSSRAGSARTVELPVATRVTVSSYDARGRLVSRHVVGPRRVRVPVAPFGFTTVLQR